MSRCFSTSRIHREVIQAKGQSGSNQKSALVMSTHNHAPGNRFPPASVAGCRPCLEPTSPGTRPPPAPPSWTSRRTPSTSTSRPVTRPSRRPPRSPSPAGSSAAATFADLVGAIVHEITLNGETLDPFTAYVDSRIAAGRPPGGQHARGEGRLHLLPHRRGPAPLRRPRRRPRLPLQPVRGARRPPRLHHLRAARPQVGLHLQRDRPRPLEGRSPTAPTPEPEDLGDGKAVWNFPVTERMSTYITAVVAGEYHEVLDTYEGKFGDHPARPLLPPVAGRVHGHRRARRADAAELRVLRGEVRLPLPVPQVRPALRARVQHGRDGERRLRDPARRVPPPLAPAALVLRVPRVRHHPRDGAHVVRRPGHHEVVGRPLAQRVLRRVGLLLVRGRGDRVHRRVDRLRQRPQADRLPRRPAAVDAPDRGRQRRPARGRGQLRHDHLRQGRLGAQAARRVGRPRRLRRRHPAVLQGPRLRQHRVLRPARRAGEVVGPRAHELGHRVAADRRRQHPHPGLRARRRRQLRVVLDRADRAPGLADAASSPPRHRPVRRRRRPPRAPRSTSRSTSRVPPPRSPSSSARPSPRCCCSTTRTTPTPRSVSTSARSPR